MSKVTIYHNPRCSKSRQTLKLLRDRGIAPRVIAYLDRPPSVEELGEILEKLGLPPRRLMRSGEKEYQARGLDDPALDDAALIAAMVAAPILIERPIVVVGERAAIGRPPEAVLKLL